jgi:hypothetical protein
MREMNPVPRRKTVSGSGVVTTSARSVCGWLGGVGCCGLWSPVWVVGVFVE